MGKLQFLVIIILISSILISSISCALFKLKPTIELVLSIHAYSKAKILPYTLSSIENQDYPKNRTRVTIYLDLYPHVLEANFNRQDQRYERNWLTLKILKTWIRVNQPFYHDISVNYNYLDPLDEPLVDLDEYWNPNRFNKIIKLKTIAFSQARLDWADYLLLMDSDVALVNEETLSHLVDSEKSLIAPMLYSLGTYSNYWAGMNEKGYYLRTNDYMPILDRTKLGIFQVPMIHSCILIDMRISASHQLTFNATHLNNCPYDDIIAFALSAKSQNLSMYITNQEIWGYLMPSVESMDLNRFDQELIDLQLEATIEGAFFPLSKELIHLVDTPIKDKLGVDQVYIINLERRPERKEAMAKRMDILGIDATFWKAVDGKLINEEFLKEKGIKFLPNYEDPYHKRPMTYGEIGCFLSHYNVWLDMLSNNYSMVVIFEDDVRFERSFRPRFNLLLEAIKTYEKSFGPADLIYLGRKIQTDESESRTAINGLILPNYSYWTIGYVLTKLGAQRLIDSKPLEKLLPIDEFLPIMFDKHPNPDWSKYYPNRNLRALSASPLLISPTHYVGDEQYISDTEDSKQIIDAAFHPKNHHQEL